MCGKGDGKGVSGTDDVSHEHGRIEILAKAPILFGYGNTEKPQLPRFVKQTLHQPLFLRIDAVQVRKDLCFQKVRTGLADHPLFLVKIFRDEYIIAIGLPDHKFPPFDRFFKLGFHILFFQLLRIYNNSKIPAAPCPVPTHMVTIPYFWFRRLSSWKSCTESFAPVHPSGWPKAMAPPFTLSTSGLMPSLRITTRDCEANASFNSISPMSSSFIPAIRKALGIASTGPMPMIRGGTPATP